MARTTHPIQENRDASRPTEPALPLDQVYGILSSNRRRRTLRYLLRDAETNQVSLSDLAEHIASVENDKSVRALSSSERKRVYISLYQCHLPKLDDADVVDFDADRKTVELAANADDVIRFMPGRLEREATRDEREPTGLINAIAGWLPAGS